MVHRLSSHLHYVVYALDTLTTSHRPPLKALAWLVEAATPSRCCWFEHGSAIPRIKDSSRVGIGIDIDSSSAVGTYIIQHCVCRVCMSPKNARILGMIMDSVSGDSSISRSVARCHVVRIVIDFASVVSITMIVYTVIEVNQCAA